METQQVMYILMVQDMDRMVDFYTSVIDFRQRSVSANWSELAFGRRKCQGRRDIRPRGGARVYQSVVGVERKCPAATGVVRSVDDSEVGGAYASGESPAGRRAAACLLCLRR